jgi:predicted ATP-grasp superfamily ATP-dependent carboligase
MSDMPYAVPAIVLDSELKSQEGVIQALGQNHIPVIAISSKADCPAFHSKYVKSIHVSTSASDDENRYIDFLLHLPDKGVLIYSDDVGAVLISKHQHILKKSGFLINIPDHDKLETLFDKWECYRIAEALNVTMAKSKLISHVDEIEACWDDFEKPVILKGTRLAGGNYCKIERKDSIPDAWKKIKKQIESVEYRARKSRIMIQEYHSFGMQDNWSCETLYTKESKPLGFFPIKRIRCSMNADQSFSSILLAGYYQYNAELINTTERILTAMAWKGFAHVEYFYVPKHGKFFLTEVNPRLPGYAYYPGKAGFNMAFLYYLDLMGKEIAVQNNFKKSVFFTTFTYPGDLTEGIKYIVKRQMKLFPLVKSYLILFKRGWTRVIDPIHADDMPFTIWKQLFNIKVFANKCLAFIAKNLRLCSTHQAKRR